MSVKPHKPAYPKMRRYSIKREKRNQSRERSGHSNREMEKKGEREIEEREGGRERESECTGRNEREERRGREGGREGEKRDERERETRESESVPQHEAVFNEER